MGVSHSSAWEQPRPVGRGQVAAALALFLAASGRWGWRPCIRAFGDFWRFSGAAPILSLERKAGKGRGRGS